VSNTLAATSTSYTIANVNDNAPDGFTLTMTDTANTDETVHSYTVTGTAKGDASADVSSSTTIAKVCTASKAVGFEGSAASIFSFDLPESGTDPKEFPDSKEVYITSDLAGDPALSVTCK
jgi:hypothetical protein